MAEGEASDADVAHKSMLESFAEAEDERILKELKEKLADERFARKVTAMQRDIALDGRDRLLRENLKMIVAEPSKHEQVVTCECGWTGTVEKPKTLHMVDIECPECEGTIRLEEDDGLDEG